MKCLSNLRDYQLEAVNALWVAICNGNTALCHLATGLGKTRLIIGFIEFCIGKFPELKVIFIVNKINLLEQTAQVIKDVSDLSVDIYFGKTKSNLSAQVTVATIQSIKKIDVKSHLVILDEAHNVGDWDTNYSKYIQKLMDINPKCKAIGLTATPFRSDGLIYGEDKFFKKITFSRGLMWGIENGFLVPPRLKKVDEQFDVSKLRMSMGDFRKDDIEKLTSDQDKMRRQVQDALSRLDGRKKICWACSSIAHSEALKEELIRCGENAVALHSGQSKEDQSNAKASFESGPMRHLTFVSIVSEGYDYPPIDAMILMRPTRSPVLYVQTIGRALRPSEGKIDAMILDYGKVIESCGPLDNPIIRSKSTPKAMLKKAQMKFCPECLEYTSPRASECHVCGHSFVTEIKKSFTEKLEMQSYDGPLFSNTPKEEKIRMVCFSRHKSKNGNDCLKISYRPFGIFDESINEFFVVNNDYGFGKLMDRVKCFGISHFSDDIFGRHFSFEGEKTLSIKHRADGNYRKIVSLDFSKASA